MKKTITIMALIAMFIIACGTTPEPAPPTPVPGPDVEATIRAMQPRIEAAVREHLAEQIAIQEAHIADQYAQLQARADEIETQARAVEAIPAPVREDTVRASNASVDEFASCLNHISREISVLPLREGIKDTGNPLSGTTGRDAIISFSMDYCRHLAPVTKKQDNLEQCVIDHAFYMHDNFPGDVAMELGLPFALEICTPPYRGD